MLDCCKNCMHNNVCKKVDEYEKFYEKYATEETKNYCKTNRFRIILDCEDKTTITTRLFEKRTVN